MCSLEFIDTGVFQEKAFGFRETKAFFTKMTQAGAESSAFADAGYDSAIFFELLGPILILVLLSTTLELVRLLARFVLTKCSKDNWLRRKLIKKPPYLIVISRFLLEGAIEIGLSAMITILMLEKDSFQNPWEVVSIIFAILSIIGLILSPIYFARVINKYLDDAESADDPKESEHYNLFENYRVKKQALWYPIVFWLRRYSLILVLTLLNSNAQMQIIAHLVTTSYVIYYLTYARPQNENFVRYQEIANELMCVFATYPLFCFTQLV